MSRLRPMCWSLTLCRMTIFFPAVRQLCTMVCDCLLILDLVIAANDCFLGQGVVIPCMLFRYFLLLWFQLNATCHCCRRSRHHGCWSCCRLPLHDHPLLWGPGQFPCQYSWLAGNAVNMWTLHVVPAGIEFLDNPCTFPGVLLTLFP